MKKTILIILLAVTIIAQSGCAGKKEAEPVSKDGFFFDTTCNIAIYEIAGESPDEDLASEIIDETFDLCKEYENLISRTKEGSNVYELNHAGGGKVKCDPVTVELVKEGIKYGKLSGGRFDITIGKVKDLWDYHAENPKLPDDAALAKALATVDYREIEIDGNYVSLGNKGASLDLGAIGKGYVADRASELLREKKVTSAIVNFGGNIECIGSKAGEPFKIGIEKPYANQTDIVGITKKIDETVVTSGIYERYVEVDGKKYHHILDVKTGYPVKTDVEGVTISGPEGSSMECDAMSTICLILGREKGYELIEQSEGLEALFIDDEGETVMTEGFDFERK